MRRRTARKRFGQHFLEPAWADKVIDAIAPQPSDRFLEIGPGTGALTRRLAPRVRELTAVELDRDLAHDLVAAHLPNTAVIQADILEFDLEPLLAAGPLRVAGNLPYNVASPILVALGSAARRSPALVDATVMLQLEVADRLTASPGTRDYSVLGIVVGLHADVTRCLTLPPGAFRPVPKVRSAVVRLTFRPPLVSIRDEEFLIRVVRTLFNQRRKTLANALRPLAEEYGLAPKAQLERAGLDPSRRPETLQLAELARLAELFPSG